MSVRAVFPLVAFGRRPQYLVDPRKVEWSHPYVPSVVDKDLCFNYWHGALSHSVRIPFETQQQPRTALEQLRNAHQKNQ